MRAITPSFVSLLDGMCSRKLKTFAVSAADREGSTKCQRDLLITGRACEQRNDWSLANCGGPPVNVPAATPWTAEANWVGVAGVAPELVVLPSSHGQYPTRPTAEGSARVNAEPRVWVFCWMRRSRPPAVSPHHRSRPVVPSAAGVQALASPWKRYFRPEISAVPSHVQVLE